ADSAGRGENDAERFGAAPAVLENPARFYGEIGEIDLDQVEPHVVGPRSPDRDRPISQLGGEARQNRWPLQIKNALIGSCTNSSYEDMRRAAHIAQQGMKAGLRAKIPCLITSGSERVYKTIKREGHV